MPCCICINAGSLALSITGQQLVIVQQCKAAFLYRVAANISSNFFLTVALSCTLKLS